MEATCTQPATQPAGAGREDGDTGRTKPLSSSHIANTPTLLSKNLFRGRKHTTRSSG